MNRQSMFKFFFGLFFLSTLIVSSSCAKDTFELDFLQSETWNSKVELKDEQKACKYDYECRMIDLGCCGKSDERAAVSSKHALLVKHSVRNECKAKKPKCEKSDHKSFYKYKAQCVENLCVFKER